MSRNIRVSPSTASLLFGVSERSIRRAVIKKELDVVIHSGRYRINLKDLVAWSEQKSNRRNKRDEEGLGQYVKEWRI
ncbi:MAG: helix-turn-helix domain-containing protein [Candidatus Kuenenbacteria bacterium]